MNWLKFTLWTYIVFTLHSTVSTGLAVAGNAPNLVLAGLVVLACRTAGPPGLLAAALWGLLADCLADDRLGAGVVCFSLSTWLLQRCTRKGSGHLQTRLAVLSIFLIWTDILGMAVLRGLFDSRPVDLQGLCIQAAGSAVYTAIVVAAVEFAVRIVRGNSAGDAVISVPTVSNKWKMLTE